MSEAPRKGMVLAAGLGKRMRPLTLATPKPLIAVGGATLLDRALDWMHEGGVEDVVVNTHYLEDQIHRHLASRAQPRLTISSEAAELLETGGGIAKALPHLGHLPFIACNSDTICLNGAEHALSRLNQAWRDSEMDALLLLHPVEKAVGYEGQGDFFLENGRPVRRGAAARAPYVFTGVQLLHPRLFAGYPEGPFSMNLLYDRAMPRLRALVHDGDWLHVGDPQGLAQAETWLAANR